MYVSPNFKTKKALKEAVAAYNAYQEALAVKRELQLTYGVLSVGAVLVDSAYVKAAAPVRVFSPGMFPAKTNGWESVEGPHYPQPHTWYAEVEVKNGVVVKVK